jgi:hypothetical protein
MEVELIVRHQYELDNSELLQLAQVLLQLVWLQQSQCRLGKAKGKHWWEK